MKILDHPFIVCLFDTFEDDQYFYLVTELVGGGTLLSHITRRGSIPETEARRIFHELMLAIKYIHKDNQVCHRDIKAENVLLDVNGNIRLTDFGFARTYDIGSLMKTSCGSPAYLPPEVIKGEGYTAEADIWSAGVLLYSMVIGKHPFHASNTPQLLASILGDVPLYPGSTSTEFRDLVQGLLRKNPAERLTIDEILTHPWLSDYIGFGEETARHLRVLPEVKLDDAVLGQMHALNFTTGDLLGALQRGEIDKATAMYKMLRRERHEDELRQWQEKLSAQIDLARNGPRIPLADRFPFSNSYGNHGMLRPLHPAFMMMGNRAIDSYARKPGLGRPRVRRLFAPTALVESPDES
jgi:serine/threonine protein kinase